MREERARGGRGVSVSVGEWRPQPILLISKNCISHHPAVYSLETEYKHTPPAPFRLSGSQTFKYSHRNKSYLPAKHAIWQSVLNNW